MSLKINTDFSQLPPPPPSPYFQRESSEATYKKIQKLGFGGFGAVWKVYTPRGKHTTAMKVNTRESSEAAHHLLVNGAPHVLPMRDSFKLSRRYSIDRQGDLHAEKNGRHSDAIIMDILTAPDTFEAFLKDAPGETTLSSAEIFEMARQGCETLDYFQSKQLVHRDIKPENLSYNRNTKELLFFDFGTVEEIDKIDPSVMEGTLNYRAPEQMLYMKYTESVDVWSLASALFALYTGYPIVNVRHTNNSKQMTVDYFHSLIQNLGPLPDEFKQDKRFFNIEGKIIYQASEETKQTVRYFQGIHTKYQKESGTNLMWKTRIYHSAVMKGETPAQAKALIDFLEPMLRYKGRVTPKEALEHLARPKVQGSESAAIPKFVNSDREPPPLQGRVQTFGDIKSPFYWDYM